MSFTVTELQTRLTEIETRLTQVNNQVNQLNQELTILHGGRAETLYWLEKLKKTEETSTSLKRSRRSRASSGKPRSTTVRAKVEAKANGHAKVKESTQVSGSV